MTLEDIKILDHKSTGARRFGHWIKIRDHRQISGIAARKSFIKFFEQTLGPLGTRWQYERRGLGDYILKLNEEKDLLIFILRAR